MAVWGSPQYEYDHLFKLVLIEGDQQSNKRKFLDAFLKTNASATGGGGGKAKHTPDTPTAGPTGKCARGRHYQ